MVQSYGRRLGGDHDHGAAGSGGATLSPTDLWLGQRSSAPADSDIPAGATAFYTKSNGNLFKKPKGGSETQLGSVQNPLAADLDAAQFDISSAGHFDARTMETRDSALIDVWQDGFVPRETVVPQVSVTTVSDSRFGDLITAFVRGEYVYIAEGNGLTTVALDGSAQPRYLTTHAGPNVTGCNDVAAYGNHAIVASFSVDAVAAVDISDPSNLSTASAASGTELDGVRRMVVRGGKAYASAFNGDQFTVVDVSDPNNLSIDGTVAYSLGTPWGVGLREDHCFVASQNGGIASIDVSDPANPEEVQTLSTGDMGADRAVFVQGDTAYMSSLFGGVTLVDVSTPDAMEQIGHFDTASSNTSEDVWVVGDYCYLANNDTSEVILLDVSDPSSISKIGTFSDSDLGNPQDVFVQGDKLYVTDAQNDIFLIFGSRGVMATGTVTASTGSDPAVDTTINGVFSDQHWPFEFVVYLDPDAGQFNNSSAFNYDWSPAWDETNEEMDVDVVVNWDNDPGSNMTLRWAVIPP